MLLEKDHENLGSPQNPNKNKCLCRIFDLNEDFCHLQQNFGSN